MSAKNGLRRHVKQKVNVRTKGSESEMFQRPAISPGGVGALNRPLITTEPLDGKENFC